MLTVTVCAEVYNVSFESITGSGRMYIYIYECTGMYTEYSPCKVCQWMVHCSSTLSLNAAIFAKLFRSFTCCTVQLHLIMHRTIGLAAISDH